VSVQNALEKSTTRIPNATTRKVATMMDSISSRMVMVGPGEVRSVSNYYAGNSITITDIV
jgi:hypothetical protein